VLLINLVLHGGAPLASPLKGLYDNNHHLEFRRFNNERKKIYMASIARDQFIHDLILSERWWSLSRQTFPSTVPRVH
jgi:hypothetical protein